MKKAINSKRGFSLVELIVVITILAILSVIGMQAVGPIIAKSKAQTDMSNGDMLGNALARAFADGDLTPPASFVKLEPTAAGGQILINSKIVDAIPEVKAKSTLSFYYSIDDQGVIKVYIGPSGANVNNSVQCYPKDPSATNFNKVNEFKILN